MSNSAQFDNLGAIGAPKGDVGDYAHAAALYLRSNYRLTPKTKFLYHVVFNLNQEALSQLGVTGTSFNKKELNLLCSQAEAPKYSIDTDTKNQYNRKKVIQTRMRYQPLRFTFHDDRQGTTNLFWESYFRYNYQDPNLKENDFNPKNLYSGGMNSRYGLDKLKSAGPLIKSITVNQIYSIAANSKFEAFTLVNPIIASWDHDELDQTDGANFLQNTMAIEYESVYYERGNTGEDNPVGFRDPAHYDTGQSKLSTGGGTNTGFIADNSNAFSDLVKGNIPISTLLAGFNIFNQNLPTNNTGFSISGQPTTNPLPAGQNNFQFPRQTTYSSSTESIQASSPVISGITGRSRGEIAQAASQNSLFASELAQSAFAVLPSSSFDSDLQNALQDYSLAGNITERNAVYANLSESQKQSAVNTAIENIPNIQRRLSA